MSATSTIQRITWICPNCSGESRARRKRCAHCGTSRH
ncbi:DUF2089 domain-containing protein [Trujillonella endophytica]|nr:DUF2089 domain-containing protein [Trujillella endophytica]